LINTLFNTSLYAKKNVPAPHHERSKTVAIESITAGQSLYSLLQLSLAGKGELTKEESIDRHRGEWCEIEVDCR